MVEWLCGFALIAQVFCSNAEPALSGYIEGETVFIAPIAAARVESLAIRRGDSVRAGDALVTLDSADAHYALEAARARVAETEARLGNLTTGKRAEEIAVIEASRAAARADLAQAGLDLERIGDLVRRRVQSQSALDQARTAHDVAKARLSEIEASLQVAGIAARVQEIEAARRVVDAARAELNDAEWRLGQRTLSAPANGRIETVIRYPGEIAGPSAPVLMLLPDANRKLRVFVPEPRIARVRIGDLLAVSCDSCSQALQARVNFIAAAPEFTPPQIYSVENRQKLVVLVEAEPIGDARLLAPGQIVDVTLPAAP